MQQAGALIPDHLPRGQVQPVADWSILIGPDYTGLSLVQIYWALIDPDHTGLSLVQIHNAGLSLVQIILGSQALLLDL